MGLGLTEITLIVVVVLLLFGAKRIPDLAKALGRASHEFKKAKDGIVDETQDMMRAAEKQAETEDKIKTKKDAEKKPDQD